MLTVTPYPMVKMNEESKYIPATCLGILSGNMSAGATLRPVRGEERSGGATHCIAVIRKEWKEKEKEI